MKKILTYLFSIVIIGALSFLYSFSLVRNSNKKITKVVVEFVGEDSSFLTPQMVNKLLIQNNRKVKNQPKSVLDLQGLEQVVLSNPYVEKATVFYTIDGVFKTIVKQRTPIARINTGNSSYYVDKQGVEVPLSANYSARVILVTGDINKNNLKEVIRFVNVILADDFLKKEIIGVHKTQKNESAKGKKGLSGKKSKTGLTAQNKDPIKVNPARTKKALQILKKHYTVEKISIEIKYSPSAIYAVMNDKHEQVSQQLQTNCITMLKKHRSSKP